MGLIIFEVVFAILMGIFTLWLYNCSKRLRKE